MYFTQFYQKSATSDKTIEACGDRAVIILDGREQAGTHHSISRYECVRRGYTHYSVHTGSAFSRSRRISDIVKVAK